MKAQAFLKELDRLIKTYPKSHSHNYNSEECDQGDQLYYSKRLIYSFDCLNCIDSLYLFDSLMCAGCIDCDYCNSSELCYQSVDANKCFNSSFLENCTNLTDSSYCCNCRDSKNLFGCINLSNKSYCIFNRQISKKEYEEKIEKLNTLPEEKILRIIGNLKKQFPITQTQEANNQNCQYGNYVYNSKNSYMCFDSKSIEASGYLYDGVRMEKCFDSTFSGDSALCYEIIDSEYLFNCNFVVWSSHCRDSSYLFNCLGVDNCLGCVELLHKKYCILNRQFNKEEYEKESKQILEDLKNMRIGWGNLSL